MSYLLDTCLLLEFSRLRPPDGRVCNWLDSIDEEKLFLSVITLGEIGQAIERLPDSRRKNELMTWLNDDLVERFSGRMLELDLATLLLWGSLTARMEANGQPPMSVMDSLLAASALHNNLILVTRNTAEFVSCGVQLLNPLE
jgi:predicted nucleic acid-binding protein